MIKTEIKAEIVGHSLSPQGDELISVLCTFPRIILAEVNTHRMLSKNTSSSRAIPFEKMVEAVQNNPFIPIAWQKEHKGMQGSKYITEEVFIKEANANWLQARDYAVKQAKYSNQTCQVTKQLCNRLLEPFMWTTMLITGSKEGWQNFFHLRCPNYEGFKSRKEASKEFLEKGNIDTSKWSDLDWLHLNKGQAEIHMMALAESIYDAVNESTPKQLKAGEWHIPFEDKLSEDKVAEIYYEVINNDRAYNHISSIEETKVRISTSLAARTSYTVVGDEKEVNYSKMIELHDRLVSQDPPHSSPMEHCCLCVTEDEYNNSFKGQEKGWFRNYKGFKSYRHIIETQNEQK